MTLSPVILPHPLVGGEFGVPVRGYERRYFEGNIQCRLWIRNIYGLIRRHPASSAAFAYALAVHRFNSTCICSTITKIELQKSDKVIV
jgi:hypothetical protein